VDGKRYLSKGIGTSAFISCPIKSIGIPSNVEVIGEQCLSWCYSNVEVTFESGCDLKKMGEGAFSSCPLNIYHYPNDLTRNPVDKKN
jgi:putative transposon-encoded protein